MIVEIKKIDAFVLTTETKICVRRWINYVSIAILVYNQKHDIDIMLAYIIIL